MPRIYERRPQPTPTSIRLPLAQQKKPVDYFGTPKELYFSIVADGCMAAFGGGGAIFLGRTALAVIAGANGAGALLGSISGVNKALLKLPDHDFDLNIHSAAPFGGIGFFFSNELALGFFGASVFATSSGLVGKAVHANITRLNGKNYSLAGKTVEWTAGALAATAVGGVAAPSLGLIAGTAAGIAAAKIAKMVVREVWSNIFG